jgi:hypothetical protein
MELQEIKFAVSALASGHPGGSHEKALAENAARGIKDRLDWVIATLEAAGEGKKNMAMRKHYDETPP